MDGRLLLEYKWMKREIADLEDRINSIYEGALFPGIKKISDMPMATGYSTEGLAKLMEQLEELVKQYTDEMVKLTELCARIENDLDELESSLDRQILRLRYIDAKSWKEIGAIVGYSTGHVERLHKKIMLKIKDATQCCL